MRPALPAEVVEAFRRLPADLWVLARIENQLRQRPGSLVIAHERQGVGRRVPRQMRRVAAENANAPAPCVHTAQFRQGLRRIHCELFVSEREEPHECRRGHSSASLEKTDGRPSGKALNARDRPHQRLERVDSFDP